LRRKRWLVLFVVLGILALASTAFAGFSTFDTAQYIISGSGTRVYASSVTPSGGPLIFSSYPEYATGSGKLFSYPVNNTRFRTYLYHVNNSGTNQYLGFAIKNEGTASANLYVNKRGYAVGTDASPALVGRDAQYKWYNTPNADSAGCGGCDVYIATIPAGGYWYSTNPVTGAGAPPAVAADFLTTTLSGNRGLYNGIYDFALVNNSTGGSNAFCGSTKLSFNVTVDFDSINGASRYFDIYNNNPGENICTIINGSAGAYGNYGIDYELNLSFIDTGGYTVHWAATSPIDDGSKVPQYFAGVMTQNTTSYTGRTSAMIHNYNGAGTDQGRELATGFGTTNRINTQLTGGNYSPLRIYFWTWN
jgi:hypothetical protein